MFPFVWQNDIPGSRSEADFQNDHVDVIHHPRQSHPKPIIPDYIRGKVQKRPFSISWEKPDFFRPKDVWEGHNFICVFKVFFGHIASFYSWTACLRQSSWTETAFIPNPLFFPSVLSSCSLTTPDTNTVNYGLWSHYFTDFLGGSFRTQFCSVYFRFNSTFGP